MYYLRMFYSGKGGEKCSCTCPSFFATYECVFSDSPMLSYIVFCPLYVVSRFATKVSGYRYMMLIEMGLVMRSPNVDKRLYKARVTCVSHR